MFSGLGHTSTLAGWAAGLLLLVHAIGGCSTARPQTPPSTAPDEIPSSGDPLETVPPAEGLWAPYTVSPSPTQLSPGDRDLLAPCALVDDGLVRVAERLAEYQSKRMEMLGNDEIAFEMRAAGVPQVWPRAWAIVGETAPEEAALGLRGWLGSFDDGGERRCGLGRAASSLGEVVAVVALDAIADLEALPRTARVGQWLDVRARLLVSASRAEVVVLGPRGTPRSVPSSLSGSLISARVVVDYPGPWLIQVLPTLDSGPRPAVEAMVFVDQPPPRAFQATAVPGEVAASDPTQPAALLEMLNAARQSEGLAGLRHNPSLDTAAQIHANAMMEAGRVAHDVGSGGPADRIAGLGLTPSMVGENVARATTLVHAHRALWASPSHRGNMLHSRFSDAGVGVAVGDDGGVWVCEVFASF